MGGLLRILFPFVIAFFLVPGQVKIWIVVGAAFTLMYSGIWGARKAKQAMCGRCGERNRSIAKFCAHCGQQLKS